MYVLPENVGFPNLIPSAVPPETTLNVFKFPFPEAVVITLGAPRTKDVLRLFPDESTQTLELAL